ncbi:FecR family protein [uncultured Polaribacter sp.]|uniref:FecR family protein n=1 Tax=uncultured Polaribacter sp. TaxID=174711 RepID=UPI00262995B1|nr:FecR family protein [uncultured Polaribacter sp.]
MEKNDDDIFLARWLNNELTENEKAEFESSEVFNDYQKIVKGSEKLLMPDFDKKKVFQNIQMQTTESSKVKRFLPYWAYIAAASIAILFGLFYFLNFETTYTTDFGEQLAITLPDGSEVMLNAKSTLKYDKKNWQKERITYLKGEAYFKVKKGSSFKVISKDGEVKVLGTEFNVNAIKGFYQVACFEGKVEVKSLKEKTILTKGLAYRNVGKKVENFNFRETIPSWLMGESTFKSVPLKQVIHALEKQYNVRINSDKVDVKQRFTGSFSHKNIEIALQTVFGTMEINYTFENEKTIILIKN